MATIPHDVDVERSLLAVMIQSSTAAEIASRRVTAEDFYRPAHKVIFDAIDGLRSEGTQPDTTLILDRTAGVIEPADVLEVAATEAAPSLAGRYAAIVTDHACRRRLIAAGQDLADAAAESDPWELLDEHLSRLDSIELPGADVSGLMLLDELLDRPDDQRAPWVVPGLLRRDWRVIVVATEGAGKTLMLQQIALCASQGVHPFTLEPGGRPVTTLLLDAENPDERIQDGCTPIRAALTTMLGYWVPRTFLWHRPGGIDLRSRRDVSAFEEVLMRVRPELVCAGPSYKLAERGKGEGWDESARAVQTVFDRLRTRYGFALLLEDHAPQAANGARDLRPFGSSMWLRWPELGLKLLRDGETGNVRVDHWRGARMKHRWPDELHRGGARSVPWVGWYAEGMNAAERPYPTKETSR